VDGKKTLNNPEPDLVLPIMNRLCLLLAFGLALPSARADQRDEEPRRSEPRVILYEHADFRGDSLVLYPGDELDNFSGRTFANGRGLNDGVSSIRVEEGAEVYAYEDAHYRGEALRLTESVRDLSRRRLAENSPTSWNDRISSLRVEKNRREHRRENPEAVIRKVFHDLLARAPEPADLRHYRSLIADQGWTEQMLHDHIRHGNEYRREGVDRIIRRAYREVLGRDPDPGGLKQYRRALLEKDWTEGDLRDDLQRSEEYRRKSDGH
jgi:hypothetical protein